MTRVSLWLVGDRDTPEFAHVASRLPQLGACRVFDGLVSALAALRQTDDPPHVVVVVQTRPSEFRDSDLWAIYEAAPLARVCVIVGPWCEGEPRSGHPPAGVLRYYWHQWEPRLSDDIARLEQDRCPLWGMPLTAVDDERLLETAGEPALQGSGGLIAVHTPSSELFDCLADACNIKGLSTVWLRPHDPHCVRGVAAIVWDAVMFSDEEQRCLRTLRERFSAPVLALLAYPRRHTERLAHAAGADAILARPFLITDFWWHLDRLLGMQGASSRKPAFAI